MVAGAPFIVLGLIVVIVPAVWWFRGMFGKSQVSGLRERLAALEERRQLAADKFERVADEKTLLESAIATLQRQIAENAPAYALAGTSASVASHVTRFDNLWSDANTTIAMSRGADLSDTPLQ